MLFLLVLNHESLQTIWVFCCIRTISLVLFRKVKNVVYFLITYGSAVLIEITNYFGIVRVLTTPLVNKNVNTDTVRGGIVFERDIVVARNFQLSVYHIIQ